MGRLDELKGDTDFSMKLPDLWIPKIHNWK